MAQFYLRVIDGTGRENLLLKKRERFADLPNGDLQMGLGPLLKNNRHSRENPSYFAGT
jgi:hypothetical protein